MHCIYQNLGIIYSHIIVLNFVGNLKFFRCNWYMSSIINQMLFLLKSFLKYGQKQRKQYDDHDIFLRVVHTSFS